MRAAGGSRALLTWPRRLAPWAGPGPRRPGAGLGSPQLGQARPPAPAGSSQKLTCLRNRATAACQSSRLSCAGSRGLAGFAPPPRPRLANREMATPPMGRGHVGGARRVEPGGLGAGPGGAGALTTLLRAGSGPVLGAAGQRWDRGSGATMPVSGKAFRRRRADSESEEDEQDSEEVRCVWNGLSTGQRARSWLGVSPPARRLVDTLAPGSRW